MNAIVTANGARQLHQLNKENTQPPRNTNLPTVGSDCAKKPRKKKTQCPNCKTFVLHKPDNCYELESNKATRHPGWKSVFTINPTS